MAFAYIRANFDAMWAHFPMRPNLPSEITDYIAALKKANPGTNPTECCLQLSWAFNKAGYTVPRSSFRRPNTDLGKGGWGLGACDEVEVLLTQNHGPTEDITEGPNGKRSVGEMRQHIAGRQGVLVFRDGGAGQHVELWQGNTIRQRGGAPGGMSEGFIFGQPRILFWEVANTDQKTAEAWKLPAWLVGWWYVTDGNDYWYYFAPNGTVAYVERRPASTTAGPSSAENYGTVTVREERPQVRIDWRPVGGGVTVENYTYWDNKNRMHGVSNRFSPLNASKLGT